ncbi:biotin transporter BioY [Alphaproteobacteria bacterium LSUCC0719]
MNAPSSNTRQLETLADSMLARYVTNDRGLALTAQLVLVLAGSLLLALSAQFAFRIPISPVPVTGQTLAVLLIGMAYGSRLGSATVLAYLVEGGMGLPVFANGTAGWVVIMGPTGGYLIGFVAAAFALGWLAERGMGRGPISTAVAMAIGTVIIYAAGVSWLGQFIGFDKAIAGGVMPFLYGDALKLIVAAGLMPLAWRAVRALSRDGDDGADADAQ